MSSSDRNLYASLNEQLQELRRKGLHDHDSAGGEEEQRSDGSGEESLETEKKRETEGKARRSRSKSREKRSRYIPESVRDDSSASTAYNLRHRTHRPPEAYEDDSPPPFRPHVASERATYSDDDSTNYVAIAIAIIAALVVFGFLYFYAGNASKKDDARFPKQPPMADVFIKELQDLKVKTFPSQSSRLWAVVRSSVKNVFNRFSANGELKLDKSIGERSPAVLLLVADEEDERSRATAVCLAKKLANITSFVYAAGKNVRQESLDVDGSQFADEDDGRGKAKKLLDSKLDSYLNQMKANPVVVLRNVHRLSSEAALILHAYCDNENAPHKEAVYYFIAECGPERKPNVTMVDGQETAEPEPDPEPIWKAKEKDWDRLAEACLRSQWLENGKLSIDKIAPILSRIANSVVFVYPEENVEC